MNHTSFGDKYLSNAKKTSEKIVHLDNGKIAKVEEYGKLNVDELIKRLIEKL